MTKKKQARQPSTRITFVEKILRHKCNVPLWQIILVTSCLSPPPPPPSPHDRVKYLFKTLDEGWWWGRAGFRD